MNNGMATKLTKQFIGMGNNVFIVCNNLLQTKRNNNDRNV